MWRRVHQRSLFSTSTVSAYHACMARCDQHVSAKILISTIVHCEPSWIPSNIHYWLSRFSESSLITCHGTALCKGQCENFPCISECRFAHIYKSFCSLFGVYDKAHRLWLKAGLVALGLLYHTTMNSKRSIATRDQFLTAIIAASWRSFDWLSDLSCCRIRRWQVFSCPGSESLTIRFSWISNSVQSQIYGIP